MCNADGKKLINKYNIKIIIFKKNTKTKNVKGINR